MKIFLLKCCNSRYWALKRNISGAVALKTEPIINSMAAVSWFSQTTTRNNMSKSAHFSSPNIFPPMLEACD